MYLLLIIYFKTQKIITITIHARTQTLYDSVLKKYLYVILNHIKIIKVEKSHFKYDLVLHIFQLKTFGN